MSISVTDKRHIGGNNSTRSMTVCNIYNGGQTSVLELPENQSWTYHISSIPGYSDFFVLPTSRLQLTMSVSSCIAPLMLEIGIDSTQCVRCEVHFFMCQTMIAHLRVCLFNNQVYGESSLVPSIPSHNMVTERNLYTSG